MTTAHTLCLLTFASVAWGCGDGPVCANASARLQMAQPGDVVELGACVLEGPLEIPGGVTLRGAGEATQIRGEEGTVVRLGPNASLESLRIESSGCAAVVAREGSIAMRSVTVSATRGVGVGVEGAESFLLEQVRIEGPLAGGETLANLPQPPYRCDDSGAATHGLVIVDVPDVQADQLQVDGFAAFGVLALRSGLRWHGGGTEEHVGSGVAIFGGRAELSDLDLCNARQDALPVESFNGFFGEGAEIRSSRLRVCGGDTYGLMHVGTDASHEDLIAIDNGFAGVWAQGGGTLGLRGEATELRGNRFAGLAALEIDSLDVRGAAITDTREGVHLTGETGVTRAADGVHLVGPMAVTMASSELRGNARIGGLFDLAGGTSAVLALTDVQVEGSGEALGVVVQNGTPLPGWDGQVERLGTTAENDATLDRPLDIAGAVGPSCLPVAAELEGLL